MQSIPVAKTEGEPLAGILLYGPLLSVPLWLIICSVGYVLLF